MSILCLANMSWYSTRMSSTACFSFSLSSVSVQSKRFKNSILDSLSSCGFSFSFCCNSHSSFKIRVWIGVCSSMLPGFLGVGNQKVLACWSGLFVLSSSVRYVIRSGSPSGIILGVAMSTGLINLDCSGVTTENSAIWVFLLIVEGDSVVLVTLTAIFLSIIVDIVWDIMRLAVSVFFSTGVTVPVVFHSDTWSTNVVIVFVVICGIVILSWMRTAWGVAFVWLNALLTCIVKCGKWMRPWVVSMTTLLCLMKCRPIIGFVRFFITTKCSAKMWSLMSNLSVAVAVGFSNWPFTTWIWKLGRSQFLRYLTGIVIWFDQVLFERLRSHKLLSLQGHLLLSHSRNPEGHITSLSYVLWLLWRIVACTVHWYCHPSLVVLQFAKLLLEAGIILSSPLSQVVMSISFVWVSELGFLESLRLGTSALLVWFPRSGSVLDTDTWGEVSLMGDVCDSTSLLCLGSACGYLHGFH